MRQSKPLDRDLILLLLLAAAKLVFHLFTNGHYGFHRDELATLDDARHLALGLRRLSTAHAVPWPDRARTVWHVADGLPLLREETERHPDIFICRGLRQPLEKIWPRLRSFG